MTDGGEDEKRLEELAMKHYGTPFGWQCRGRQRVLKNMLLMEKEKNDIKT